MTKEYLIEWLTEALHHFGGQESIVKICRYVWKVHEQELLDSGDPFYTWQYDIRWAATKLRERKIMKPANLSPKGVWELAK